MVVESYMRGAGNGLMTTNVFVKWHQNVSDLPRPAHTLQGMRRLAPGTPRALFPRTAAAAAMMEIAMVVVKDGKFVVMLVSTTQRT